MVLLILLSLLLIIALPLGEVTRATIGLTVSFTLVDITVTFLSFLWLVGFFGKKDKNYSVQLKSFWLVIVVFCASLLLNALTLTRMQFIVSFLYILRFFSLGALFFLVQDLAPAIKKRIEQLLLLGGSLLVAGGYMQYFFYPSLRNLIYFGWDEHFYRMFGTFFDPNFFGLFLVIFFLFLLSQMFIIRVEKQKIRFALFFLLTSATFVAVFLSYSRTALVALFVGLLILFWNKHLGKLLGILSIFALATLVLFFVSNSKKTDTNRLLRTTSASARLGSAEDALTIFLDSPMYGVGFNAYRYAMYRHHFQPGSSIQEDHGASGADSSVLLVLATSGVVGLVAYLLFWGSLAKLLIQQKKRSGLAILAALFLGSFFVNGLFYPFLMSWFWIFLGTTARERSHE